MPSERLTLPGPKLKPGADDDIKRWANRLQAKNISISARMKAAIRAQYLEGENEIVDRLDRIEILLQQLVAGGDQIEATPTPEKFNDPFLDADL
jgi:hypothetical protein